MHLSALPVREAGGTFYLPAGRAGINRMPAADTVAELAPPPAPADAPAHAVATGELLARLGTDIDRGLTEAEVAARPSTG